MPAPDNLAAIQPLIDAGKTLATLASPERDLLSFGSDFSVLARDLKSISERLDAGYDGAEDRYDAVLESGPRSWIDTPVTSSYEVARIARNNELKQARARAIREAKQALVSLSRIIGEMEIQAEREGK